ncbi:MAG: alpha-glucosidase/alpha-galactosidase [Eubacteriales bacterium]|nr:alpha-glucosidase/alpha-galactosidase [Eubacteriales bacterium]
MSKIVLIGAGSGFGLRFSLDIMSCEALRDSTICLCDIHQGRLKQVADYVKATIVNYDLPTKLEFDTDRTKLLPGADFVVTSVAVGGGAYYGSPFKEDVEIPRKYGIEQSVADSTSVGAIFRFLRTGPVHLQILRDMEKYCPNAVHLNHTNPMAMLSWMHSTQTSLKTVGLCHGIYATNSVLCRYLGIPNTDARYKVAGINHMAWFLEWKLANGENLYKRLDNALENKDDPKTAQFMLDESVRLDIYKNFGYFPTESNRHDSEYLPYFRRTAEMLEAYSLPIREVPSSPPKVREWMKDGAAESKGAKLVRSNEYTTYIMEAIVTNEPFRFNGNVLNTGLITNLPQRCCVEVPCFADAHGINPTYVGDLPSQLAALNISNVNVQMLAVEAVANKNKEAAFHACALDPNAAAMLTLDKIRAMFEEMWEAEKDHLLWFDPEHKGPLPEICAPN